jgi:hypothetical protein
MVPPVRKAQLVRQVRREPPAQLGKLVLLVKLVQRAQQVARETLARQERKVILVLPEQKVQLVQLVLLVWVSKRLITTTLPPRVLAVLLPLPLVGLLQFNLFLLLKNICGTMKK